MAGLEVEGTEKTLSRERCLFRRILKTFLNITVSLLAVTVIFCLAPSTNTEPISLRSSQYPWKSRFSISTLLPRRDNLTKGGSVPHQRTLISATIVPLLRRHCFLRIRVE